MMFKHKTILVTGASGFIGGRIVERLCLETCATVIAFVHDVNHLPRIAKYNIKIIVGDILDKKLLVNITRNVDYVIHCAVGNSSDPLRNYETSVQGTKNIVEASEKNNIKQFIYFSTVSVYGHPLPDRVNENTPYKRIPGDAYNNFKIDAEMVVQKRINDGFPATILQPTIVYGPYGHGWTTHIVEHIRHHQFFLVNDGLGIANPVYIDNVVNAVLLSLTTKGAIGERFIISDGKTVTWKSFYNHFYQYVTGNNIPHDIRLRDTAMIVSSWIVRPLRKIKNLLFPFQFFSSEHHPIRKSLDIIVQKGVHHEEFIHQSHATFIGISTFEINKAKNVLGYIPAISLTKGMNLTLQWLKYRGI